LRAGNTRTLFAIAATIPNIRDNSPARAPGAKRLPAKIPAVSAAIACCEDKASDPVANMAR